MSTTKEKLFPHHCPVCFDLKDGASGVNTEREPGPGCVTVCDKCGSVLMIAEGLAVRKCTDAELAEIRQSREWKIISVIQAFSALRRHLNGGDRN